MAWHLAPSLKALFSEVDRRWPDRKRGSDGSVGDTSHAARESEHNPDRDPDPMPLGAVSAIDITKDSAAQMEEIRAALVRDPRVWYVIHNRRIWSRTHDWVPRTYTGANPHEKHLHVSLRQTKAAHDDTSSWGIAHATPPAPPSATYTVRKGDTLTKVAKDHGTTVAALVALNGIKNADLIKVGQKLRLAK